MARNVRKLKHFELPKKGGLYFRLLCLTGPDKGSAYFLEGSRIIMGRGDRSDIVIKDLKASREHAELTRMGNHFIVTDLGSQNGIIINDLKIKQHRMNSGEKIIIGKTVYKFSLIEVKKDETEIPQIAGEEKNEGSEEKKQKGLNFKSVLYILIFAAAFLIFFDDTGEGEDIVEADANQGEFREISSRLLSEISSRDRREASRIKGQMSAIFQRGLREFREGNYFRALEQFDLALSNQPSDALALFYRRKTVEALDKKIDALFIQARRDRDALKYEGASVSYCSIMRLLYSRPEDKRYKDAQKYFDELTILQGFEKDEVKCK